MAGNYASTENIRKHILGDMVLITGTFTDGAKDIFYGDHLSTVFAAGGNSTELTSTGIQADGAKAVGDTTFTVKTIDKRLWFNKGDTIYNSAGGRIGVISANAGNATGLTLESVLVAVADEEVLYKFGVPSPAMTLIKSKLTVGIDTINQYLVIGCGNMGAASTQHTADGTWWALGKR